MSLQKSAEAIVVAAYGDEGPNGLNRTGAEHSMPERGADKKAAMPKHTRTIHHCPSERTGATHHPATACYASLGHRRSLSMLQRVSRGNCPAAYPRDGSNIPAAPVDPMTVDRLMPMLRERWQAIREEWLGDAYQRATVR